MEIKSLKERAVNREMGEQWTIKRGVLFYKDQVYLLEDSYFVPMVL